MSRDAAKGRGWTRTAIYGRRTVLEALAAPDVGVERVVVSARDVPKELRAEIRSLCERRGAEYQQGERSEVTAMSREPRHDQGVAAMVTLGNVMEVSAFIDSLKGAGAKTPAPVLALDGVTNPQNVGIAVRSAVAAGMRAMLWPTVGGPWITGLVIKASAATLFRCPIVRTGELAEGAVELKGAGFRVYALEAGGEASLLDLAPAHRSLFVVGSELEGVSEEVLELADERVSIPMAGGVESLNAAVAASLVCFQAGSVKLRR